MAQNVMGFQRESWDGIPLLFSGDEDLWALRAALTALSSAQDLIESLKRGGITILIDDTKPQDAPGVYVRSLRLIMITNKELDPFGRAMILAHEIGHHCLWELGFEALDDPELHERGAIQHELHFAIAWLENSGLNNEAVQRHMDEFLHQTEKRIATRWWESNLKWRRRLRWLERSIIG